MMVVTNSTQLYEQRRQFEYEMGKLITLVNEQTSCHHGIAESLAELKVFISLLLVINSSNTLNSCWYHLKTHYFQAAFNTP